MIAPKFIPVCEPDLSGNELQYLQQCIETNWVSSEGPYVRKLEEQLAERTGRRHGIAVANGTAALEIAVKVLGLGPGDEVIVPSFTIVSSVNAIVKSGATPVLVDLEPMTLTMDVNQVREKITAKTKAIMVVHIYGLPADMDPILDLAERNGLQVIEDAAEMLGQTYKERPCGAFGNVSVFSFYANKFVTTGEGGMMVTDDEAIAAACRGFRNLCFQPARRFHHEDMGWNYRLNNLQAALGVAQLERLDETCQRKRKIAANYDQLLSGLEKIELPPSESMFAKSIYWVYGIVLSDEVSIDANKMMTGLDRRRIGSRPFFWPMHEQPVFQKMGLFHGERHPVSERLARRGFYIPNGLGLSDDQQTYITESIRQVLTDV